ncbi:11328_t:CDS:2, partial [Acaulospora morrowiae]
MITKAQGNRKRTQHTSRRAVVASSSRGKERNKNLGDSDFSASESDEKRVSLDSESSESTIDSEVDSMSVSSDDTTILTRSRREVKAINYSDEQYYASRGVTESSKRKKMDPSDSDSKKKKKKRMKVSDFAISRSTTEDSHSDNAKTRSKRVASKLRDRDEESEDETEDESEDESEDNDHVSGRRSRRSKVVKSKKIETHYVRSSDYEKPVRRQIIRDVLVTPTVPTRKYDKKFISAHTTWCVKCGLASPNRRVACQPLDAGHVNPALHL